MYRINFICIISNIPILQYHCFDLENCLCFTKSTIINVVMTA